MLLTDDIDIRDTRAENIRNNYMSVNSALQQLKGSATERINKLHLVFAPEDIVNEKRKEASAKVAEIIAPVEKRLQQLPSVIESLSAAVAHLGYLSRNPIGIAVKVDEVGRFDSR